MRSMPEPITAISLILDKHVYHICFTITAFSYLSSIFILFEPQSAFNIVIFKNPYGAQCISFIVSIGLWFGCALLAHIIKCYHDTLTLTKKQQSDLINFFISQSIYSFYVFIMQLKYIAPFSFTLSHVKYDTALRTTTEMTFFISLVTFLIILASLPSRFPLKFLKIHSKSSDIDNYKADSLWKWLKLAVKSMWNETINPANNETTFEVTSWIYTFFVTLSSLSFSNDLIHYLYVCHGLNITPEKAALLRVLFGMFPLAITVIVVSYCHMTYYIFKSHTLSQTIATLWSGFYILIQTNTFDNNSSKQTLDVIYICIYVLYVLILCILESVSHLFIFELDDYPCDKKCTYTFFSLLFACPHLYLGILFILLWLPHDMRVFETSMDALTLNDHSTWISPIILFGIMSVFIVVYSVIKYKQIYQTVNFKRTILLLLAGWMLKVAIVIFAWFIIQLALPFIMFFAQTARGMEFCDACASCNTNLHISLSHSNQGMYNNYQFQESGTRDLPLNQMKVFGVSKSYKQPSLFSNFIPSWKVAQPSIPSQLSTGLRHIELHVHHRNINDNFLVYNVDILDAQSSCNCLRSCMQQINTWHLKNYDHSLIVVRIIPSGIINKYRWCNSHSLGITHIHALLRKMINIIKNEISPNSIFLPKNMHIGSAKERIWPTSSTLKNKIMIIWTSGKDQFYETPIDRCIHAYNTMPNQHNHIMFTEILHPFQLTNTTCCIKNAGTEHSKHYAKSKELQLLTRLKVQETILISKKQFNINYQGSAFSILFKQVDTF